jgi:uncharacterized damage-inducible protein DinB
MDMLNYFSTLARYHVWTTGKMLDAVATMSDAHYREDCGLFFHSVHGTLNHMLVGERLWYARFAEGTSLKIPLNAELESDRTALANELRNAVKRWAVWVPTVDSKQFDDNLQYTRTSGEAVTTPFAPTLGHIFNHGTHHRGQISAALTAMKYPVLEIDLIYMLQAGTKK